MLVPIFGRILLLLQSGQQKICRDPKFEYLDLIEGVLANSAIEDELGPINLGKVFDICQAIHSVIQSSDQMVALVTSYEAKKIFNAILALGGYMIMHCERDLQETMQCLAPLLQDMKLNNTAATRRHEPILNIKLRVEDYLGGMIRAKRIGWVDFGPDGFDADEYKQLDSPLNGDLQEVVPGKLVVMRGPRDLPGGALWQDAKRADGGFAYRDFSAAHYADILAQLDVRAVVRCSVPVYDRRDFEAAGIAVVDLCWEDGAPPPIDVVAKFLAVAERLPGAIAVHCGSGRGRCGTLAALYLMKHHSFTAREAMGWLQLVRPGRYDPRSVCTSLARPGPTHTPSLPCGRIHSRRARIR